MHVEGIESGLLPTGHPYARIGVGERVVLSIPGLSFSADVPSVSSVARSWKRWRGPIDRHGLTFVQVGRRPDLPPGSLAADVAADYAQVIRSQWGRPVSVMGISSGGHYAQWLAADHPELVDRLVLGFTAHRVPRDVTELQNRAVEHFLAGRWRAGFALFGGWFMPKHARIGSAVTWLLGPYVIGRPKDLRVLRIDAHADDRHDATARLADIRCPTLVVSGDLDMAYPPAVVRELVTGLPAARHVAYPDAGHAGPGVRFADDACAFLGG